MAKNGTLKKQRKSKTIFLEKYVPFQSEELKNPRLVIEVLLDCIREGDPDTFREVLIAHLLTANKTQIAKKAGLGRRTLYDLMDPKKEFNPEFSTISAMIKAIAA